MASLNPMTGEGDDSVAYATSQRYANFPSIPPLWNSQRLSYQIIAHSLMSPNLASSNNSAVLEEGGLLQNKPVFLIDLPVPAMDAVIFFLTPAPNPTDRSDPFARTPWNIALRNLSLTCKSMREEIWRRKIRVVRVKISDCRSELRSHGTHLAMPLEVALPVGIRHYIRYGRMR